MCEWVCVCVCTYNIAVDIDTEIIHLIRRTTARVQIIVKQWVLLNDNGTCVVIAIITSVTDKFN